MKPILSIHNLTVTRNERKIFDHFGFDMAVGSLVTLTGSNGSGKSTLIKAILGLIPFTGHVHKPQKIGYLPQSHLIDRSFPVEVKNFIAFGCHKEPKSEASINQFFFDLGIENLKNNYISDLSQGEFQKVLLARSLVLDPQLLVLDEPFSNIDEKSAEVLKEVLLNRKRRGISILLSIHDSHFVKSNSDQIISLGDDKTNFVDLCVHDHGVN